MLLLDHPRGNRITPARGDRGVDIRVPTPDGYDIYQVKRYNRPLTSAQARDVEKSWKTFVSQTLPYLPVRSWTLVMPWDPTNTRLEWLQRLTAGAGPDRQRRGHRPRRAPDPARRPRRQPDRTVPTRLSEGAARGRTPCAAPTATSMTRRGLSRSADGSCVEHWLVSQGDPETGRARGVRITSRRHYVDCAAVDTGEATSRAGSRRRRRRRRVPQFRR